MAEAGFKGIGQRKNYTSDEDFFRDTVSVVNNMLKGRTNNTGTMSVSSGTTSTTVNSSIIGQNSLVTIMAVDSDSADKASFFLSGRIPGTSFTFTHNNSGNARSYKYTIVG